MATKIVFETSEWRASRGSEPRGRGSWACALGPDPKPEHVFFTPGSTVYADARRLAAAHFRELVAWLPSAPALLVVWVQP